MTPLSKATNKDSLKHVVLSEILSVTSTMRKNSRWASSALFIGTRDTPTLGSNMGLRISSPSNNSQITGRKSIEAELIYGFVELRRIVQEVNDIAEMELTTILSPFYAILRSPLSTGPIASAALSAFHSFFVSGVINSDSLSLSTALAELSSAVSHCKFEASDSAGDEVVLLKILVVIQDCLCGSVGNGLGDVEVCEMLETVLTTCCQMRLSEILRRSAENTMHSLVRTVFSKLHSLDPKIEEAKLLLVVEDNTEGELKMMLTTDDVQTPDQELGKEQVAEQEAETNSELVTPISNRAAYGLPSIVELLRVLINVLDPNDQQHTDSTRLIALGILNAALEESESSLAKFPSLKSLITDPGCKFLFQLARSENISLLHSALRTISTILNILRKHLKLQQELFLAFTIDRLAPPPMILNNKGLTASINGKKATPVRTGTPATPTPSLVAIDMALDSEKSNSSTPRLSVPLARGETRDLILETLSHISGYPSFMVDLYVNYDCDTNCENLFEKLVDFLTKAVYSSSSTGISDLQQSNSQFLCLELLLTFVNDMASRAEGHTQPWPAEYTTPESILRIKSQKQLILTGASRFNAKPKNGIAFLEENGLIYADTSPEVSKSRSLAAFLKSCTRLDKRLLGDFISKPDNIDILKAFIELFDFKDKPIADAMRELLESFRLPGEAQQIARITEVFASIYFASGPAEIKNEDAVYVLAYSVILLNTDLHNPQVRKRMSIEDYQRNLRGVNNGSDFSSEFLHNIYDSIRKREIIMPEEHTGQLGFEYAWKELLARSRQAAEFMMCNSYMFDVEMFKLVWRPVISAIAYAFISFEEDYIIQRAIAGFRQCATLAGHFLLPDVFDFVVVSLSQATTLLSDSIAARVPHYPVIDVEGQSVTISKLSIEFGTNLKGQLAAVVLFNIVNGNGNALREGWTQIFEMFQNLFLHSLLPIRMLQMEDFLGGVTMIPLRGSQPPPSQARSDGGLLSTLSSYLMTPYGNSSEVLLPDPTDADVENTLCTIDCINSCRLDELYSQIIQLNLDAMMAAIRALEALAHERTVARLKLHPDDSITPPANSEPYQLPYDPASVFLLEIMVSIICQSPQYIEDLWPIVFEHLSALLSASTQYSALLIERAVVGLLRLCRLLAQQSLLRDQIYVSFDLLACLPPSIANSVAEQVISGLSQIVHKNRVIIRSQTEWNLVFALIRSTLSHPEAARLSFDLVSSLVVDGPDHLVTMDNFPGLVTLLDEFATGASTVADSQGQKRRQAEQLTSSNSPHILRGKIAIDLLCNLQKQLVSLLELSNMQQELAWRQLTLPLLTSLGRQSFNTSREVRHSAISQLQRILLGPQISTEQYQVADVFNRVIFPLLDELLKPQTFHRDPQGIPETRLRSSALLCKVFMHLEVRESNAKDDLRLLWIQILDLLDRLMNIDKADQLYEAVPESLKNVLLVMNAAGILVPPTDNQEYSQRQQTLWTATHERMERFLPGFLTDVIPNSASESRL